MAQSSAIKQQLFFVFMYLVACRFGRHPSRVLGLDHSPPGVGGGAIVAAACPDRHTYSPCHRTSAAAAVGRRGLRALAVLD